MAKKPINVEVKHKPEKDKSASKKHRKTHKIKPDLIEATNDEIAARLKRSIIRDQQRFERLLERHTPNIDKPAIFEQFTKFSERNSTKLVNLATQMLAFINAIYYANQALSQALGAEDTAYDDRALTKEITKILRIKIAKLLCREFKVERTYERQILKNIIDHEFLNPLYKSALNVQSPQTQSPQGQVSQPKAQEKQSKEGSFTRTRL